MEKINELVGRIWLDEMQVEFDLGALGSAELFRDWRQVGVGQNQRLDILLGYIKRHSTHRE